MRRRHGAWVVGVALVLTLLGDAAATVHVRGELQQQELAQAAAPTTAPAPASAAPSVDPAAEAAAIEATWAQWTAAVAAGDTAARAELVATRTLDYYERLRDLALTASEIELRAETVKDQFTVYELRAGRVPVDVLRTAQGRELYEALLNTSVVVGKATESSSQPEVRLADVEVLPSGDSAFARLAGPDATSAQQVRFEREDGRWRVDLSPVLKDESDLFRLEATDATTTAQDFFDTTLPKLYGQQGAQKVRQPLGP